MSRTITLRVLAGLTLTGGLAAAAGCGGSGEPTAAVAEGEPDEPADTGWYDENGNPIPEQWKTDESGQRVLDAEGRPIPHPAVPHDRHGRVWVFHSGVWVPPVVVFGRPGYVGPVGPMGGPRPVGGGWAAGGGGGYRTPATTTPYRAPSGAGSGPVVSSGGARPAASAPPSGSSIGRGGFGSTGGSSMSSSS